MIENIPLQVLNDGQKYKKSKDYLNRCHIMMFIAVLSCLFKEIGYIFFEKMDDFSPQLGMIKCSEIKHFSMKFPSKGEI